LLFASPGTLYKVCGLHLRICASTGILRTSQSAASNDCHSLLPPVHLIMSADDLLIPKAFARHLGVQLVNVFISCPSWDIAQDLWTLYSPPGIFKTSQSVSNCRFLPFLRLCRRAVDVEYCYENPHFRSDPYPDPSSAPQSDPTQPNPTFRNPIRSGHVTTADSPARSRHDSCRLSGNKVNA
jgi:hypothetical protein